MLHASDKSCQYLLCTLKSEALEPRLAHSCRSLSQFLQHEAAASISTSPGQDASPSQVTPPQFVRFSPTISSAGTHLYTWVERGIVRVKCFAQEHNTMSLAGLEPGPLSPESSALTMRPPRFPPLYFGQPVFLFSHILPRAIKYELTKQKFANMETKAVSILACERS